MRRLSLILTAPLAVAFVVFAVSNRQPVDLNLWPFFVVQGVPVFLLALGMLAIGLVAGALVMWMPLARWRLRARSHERRIIELEAALAENRAIVARLREPAQEPARLGDAQLPPPAA
jgi:uncharacterized integral membrane protein